MRMGRAKTLLGAVVLAVVLALPAWGAPLIPLVPRAAWVYGGTVRWTPDGTTKEKTGKVTWTMEVLQVRSVPQGRAALVRGLVTELTWYEPGQKPGYSVLLQAGSDLYAFPQTGEGEARAFLAELAQGGRSLLTADALLLDGPLTRGKVWGEDRTREDRLYLWTVEDLRARTLVIPGLSPRRVSAARIAYRTQGDASGLEVAPGVGILSWTYEHRGTPAEVDVTLVRCRNLP